MTGIRHNRNMYNATLFSAIALLLTPLPLAALFPGDEPESSAPAELFTLQYSGKSLDVTLGEPFVVEIDGRKVDMRLTAKGYRILEIGGVSFQYPRDFKFSEEKEKLVRIATLEGTDSIIALHIYELGDASEIISSIAESLSKEWKKNKAEVKQSDRVHKLGTHTLKGKRLEIKTLGQTIRQEYVGLNAPSGVVLLMLQNSVPDQKKSSPRFDDALRMLKESFEISE